MEGGRPQGLKTVAFVGRGVSPIRLPSKAARGAGKDSVVALTGWSRELQTVTRANLHWGWFMWGVPPPPHLKTFGMSRAREILSDDVGGVVLAR